MPESLPLAAQHSRPMRIDGNEHHLKPGDLVDVSDELEPKWMTVAGFTYDCQGDDYCDGSCEGVILFDDADPWHLRDDDQVEARIQVDLEASR